MSISAGEFPSIREINKEIRRLNLAAYAPLRYVLAHKREAYEEIYSTRLRGGGGTFRQLDREESLVQLLRVNALKRMESSVAIVCPDRAAPAWRCRGDSWRASRNRRANLRSSILPTSILRTRPSKASWSAARSRFCSRTSIRSDWRQDLIEDRNRLATLHAVARQVTVDRDAKLAELRERLSSGNAAIRSTPHNRKAIVFTAFADTARYSIRHAGALGPGLSGSGSRSGHGRGTQPDDSAGSPARPRVHPDRFRTTDQGTAGRPCGRRRDRSSDRDRLHIRRPEPPGLRLSHQLRYPLEPGPNHPALRAHRPDRLAQCANPAC